MTGGWDEDGEPDFRLPYLYEGIVADEQDPELLGRVRLLIPGVFEEPSPWALPIGTSGGGSAQLGLYAVPPKGSKVSVMFLLGDPESPRYMSGYWAKPEGTSEAPSFLSGQSKVSAPKVRGFETPNFSWYFDDTGDGKLVIKAKGSNAKVEVGPGATEPFVLGTTLKTILEAVLDAIVAHVHPTGVGPSGPPNNAATFTTQKGNLPNALSDWAFSKKTR